MARRPSVPARINTVIYFEGKLQYFSFLREERAHLEEPVSTSILTVSFSRPSASQEVSSLFFDAKSSPPFSFHEILAFSESKIWLILSACRVLWLVLFYSTLHNLCDFQCIY